MGQGSAGISWNLGVSQQENPFPDPPWIFILAPDPMEAPLPWLLPSNPIIPVNHGMEKRENEFLQPVGKNIDPPESLWNDGFGERFWGQ